MMGVGASFIFVMMLKVVSLRLPSQHFSFFLGMMMCVGMSGLLVSDMVTLFLLQHWGWRLVCYVLAFLGVILIFVNYWYFGSRLKTTLFVNRRAPLVEDFKQLIAYFCNRCLIIRCLIGLLLYMPVICFAEVWGARFLLHSYQFSVWLRTIDLAMLLPGFAIGALFLGWLYDRTGESQLILMLGSVGSTVVLSVILCVPDLSAIKLGVLLGALGFFCSSVIVILALNRKLVSSDHLGKLFGVTNGLIMLSGISGLLISGLLGMIENYQLVKLLPFYASSAYQLALLFLPCCTLFAVFLTFYIRDDRGS